MILKLLNESWNMKKGLSKSITNSKIDNLYTLAKKNGHLGKLLGAGCVGFLLMYMKNKYRQRFFKKNPKLINVPFKFSNEGSRTIFEQTER